MKKAPGTVLHLIDTTGPGGAETIFLQIADGLRGRGWRPRMVVMGPGWVLDNVRALDLPVDLIPSRRRMDVGFVRRLRAVIQRHDVDLIHAHLFSPAVYAAAMGFLTGVPLVATFHGGSDVDAGGLGQRLRYRLIQSQGRIVCVSDALRQALVEDDLVRSERVSVIPNGIDVDLYSEAAGGGALRREHGLPENVLLVGALGNVRPAKDYPNLLCAAAQSEVGKPIRFAVVGQRTEPLYGELQGLAESLGVTDRVEFWGFADNVPAVMDAFDILVISSSSEGFSLAAIQAMAAGVPVVATRSGGPETIITDGSDGLLVPTGDPKALAEAVARIVDDPSLRRDLAERGQETVRRRYSIQRMLDGYAAVYQRLIGGDV